jgi:hypothetical protein
MRSRAGVVSSGGFGRFRLATAGFLANKVVIAAPDCVTLYAQTHLHSIRHVYGSQMYPVCKNPEIIRQGDLTLAEWVRTMNMSDERTAYQKETTMRFLKQTWTVTWTLTAGLVLAAALIAIGTPAWIAGIAGTALYVHQLLGNAE